MFLVLDYQEGIVKKKKYPRVQNYIPFRRNLPLFGCELHNDVKEQYINDRPVPKPE